MLSLYKSLSAFMSVSKNSFYKGAEGSKGAEDSEGADGSKGAEGSKGADGFIGLIGNDDANRLIGNDASKGAEAAKSLNWPGNDSLNMRTMAFSTLLFVPLRRNWFSKHSTSALTRRCTLFNRALSISYKINSSISWARTINKQIHN